MLSPGLTWTQQLSVSPSALGASLCRGFMSSRQSSRAGRLRFTTLRGWGWSGDEGPWEERLRLDVARHDWQTVQDKPGSSQGGWALTTAWYLLAWLWGVGSRGAHCSSRISALDRNSLSFCTLQRKHRDAPHPCQGQRRGAGSRTCMAQEHSSQKIPVLRCGSCKAHAGGAGPAPPRDRSWAWSRCVSLGLEQVRVWMRGGIGSF